MTTTDDEFDAPADEEPTLEDYEAAAAEVRADLAKDGGKLPPSDDEPAEEENPNKREARYRVQLREVEAERDQLRGTVEALQRAEVERIAAQSIQQPKALWSADVDLSSLLDDAGRVDPLKVNGAVKEAANTLGLASKRPGGYVRGEGQVVGQGTAGNAWENAFK